MSDPSFSDVEACVFDAYGTLFDVHSAAARLKAEIGEHADSLSAVWRQKQLEYSWLRSLMGRHEDFWHLTGSALDFAMAKHGLDNPGLRSKLMEMYLELDAYPDVAETLTRLRDSGRKTAILSNGSPSMLIAAVKSAGIYPLFDAILSVESVGIFKPHPSTYQIAVDSLKVMPGHVAFMSSNGWDAHGATAFGFVAVWVNRFKQPRELLPAPPHTELGSLAEIPALLGV